MKCPFCAEEIQNDAILCRFCGAAKEESGWKSPGVSHHKSSFTIRTAAVFFLASAIFEAFSLHGAMPLFGAVRSGAAAMAYHLLYVGLFAALGLGLWSARRWGLWIMLGGTIFYTLDRIRYLLDRQARDAELAQGLQDYEEILELVDPSLIFRMMDCLALVSVACWWGFMIYLYFRRSYFR